MGIKKRNKKRCLHNHVIAYYCIKCKEISLLPPSDRINCIGSIATDYQTVALGEQCKQE